MAGMWELPEIVGQNRTKRELFTLRHSITVTNYTVRVWLGSSSERLDGKWIRNDRLSGIALTGLAKKILRNAGIVSDLASTSNGPLRTIRLKYEKNR